MIIDLFLLLAGLLILAGGSHFFISSSSYIARHFGVSEFIVGLTLVSVGTSLPEFGASVYASAYGSSAIAVGNIVGSNIANIALVLGVSIIICPIKTSETMLKRDGLIMLGVSLLFIGLALDGVSRIDGLVLMACFVLYMRLLYVQRRVGEHEPSVIRGAEDNTVLKETAKLLLGAAGVFIGAKLLVDSAIAIAVAIGVSQSVIGVTLVAFGTSAPELAVSLTALRKRYGDMVIGNIIGSNIFNILWVGGAASLIRPLSVDEALLGFSMPIMLFVAALLLVFMRTGWRLKRWEGAILVVLYVGFIFSNF